MDWLELRVFAGTSTNGLPHKLNGFTIRRKVTENINNFKKICYKKANIVLEVLGRGIRKKNI